MKKRDTHRVQARCCALSRECHHRQTVCTHTHLNGTCGHRSPAVRVCLLCCCGKGVRFAAFQWCSFLCLTHGAWGCGTQLLPFICGWCCCRGWRGRGRGGGGVLLEHCKPTAASSLSPTQTPSHRLDHRRTLFLVIYLSSAGAFCWGSELAL